MNVISIDLDTAIKVVRVLQRIAETTGMIVICVVHDTSQYVIQVNLLVLCCLLSLTLSIRSSHAWCSSNTLDVSLSMAQ